MTAIVDTAKKLGIQTLAEGVETEEQAEFLWKIGCEKQQGYLYSRPYPREDGELIRLSSKFGIEEESLREYYDRAGRLNTLSFSPLEFYRDDPMESGERLPGIPLALVEYSENRFRHIFYNAAYEMVLKSIGKEGARECESDINNVLWPYGERFRAAAETIVHSGETAYFDFTEGESYCTIRSKVVAVAEQRVVYAATLENIALDRLLKKGENLSRFFAYSYQIYEHADVLHLSENYSEPLFSNGSFEIDYAARDLRKTIECLAEKKIFQGDRKRFLQFMKLSTMQPRLREKTERFLIEYFRMRDKVQGFIWKAFVLIDMGRSRGDQVMLCIRRTSRDKWEGLRSFYEEREIQEAQETL